MRPSRERSRAGVIALVALIATAGCRVRESPDAVKTKVRKDFLEKQVAGLTELLASAQKGELVTHDQIAISVDESVAQQILNASLPRDQPIGDHAVVRIEHAEAYFRGNQAAMGFRARVTSDRLPDQFAELELGGNLEDLKLVDGRLAGRVEIAHFTVRKASVGPLAQGIVENLVRGNLQLIQGAIPPFELPVKLDQQVKIDEFNAGPVSAAGGELPLTLQVSQVLPIRERLWILIGAKAGPWKPKKAATTAPVPTPAPATPSPSPTAAKTP